MVLNFESFVSDQNYWEKLVAYNWLKIQRHLLSFGINKTSELAAINVSDFGSKN